MLRGGMGGSELLERSKEAANSEAQAFEKHKRNRSVIACPCCPVACRERIDLPDGEYAGLTSYHSLTSGGSLNMLGVGLNYDQLVKYNDTMNRYGIDNMLFANTLGLLFDLYENGVIGKEALDGLELERNFFCIMKVANMVAYRQGFGNIIADGTRAGVKCPSKRAHMTMFPES